MRGEYHREQWYEATGQGSPPLARGVLYRIVRFNFITWDHPRLRGEYSSMSPEERRYLGSPPLARGVLTQSAPMRTSPGITPACAGSTFHLCGYSRYFRDHPRLRGEYKSGASERSYKLGSPPLARGVPACTFYNSSTARITPACAGSTLCIKTTVCQSRDHPRLRGEYF